MNALPVWGNDPQIWVAAARIDDAPAIETFLAPIPRSEQIRALLGSKFNVQGYDVATRRDTWVSSDGTEIRCVTIVNIDVEDAARVRLLCEQMREHVREEHGADAVFQPESIAVLVSHVTGGKVNLVN